MPTYAITGISGNVGGAAAQLLLAQGVTVRAVVRSQVNAEQWRVRGAEAFVAELSDMDALKRAFANVDGVFVMTPTWFQSGNMFEENAKAIQALHDALRATGSPKVVLLSSIGAHRTYGTGAIGKLHALEHLFRDLPSVTSIRAGWFMENYAGFIPIVRKTRILPSMLVPMDRMVPMVATIDIGTTVAAILVEDWDGHHVIELEGPRRYTPNDVAKAFATVLGHFVKAQELPYSDWNATYRSWGLSECSSQAMSEMLQGFNSGWIAYEANDTQTKQGITPLEIVLSRLL